MDITQASESQCHTNILKLISYQRHNVDTNVSYKRLKVNSMATSERKYIISTSELRYHIKDRKSIPYQRPKVDIISTSETQYYTSNTVNFILTYWKRINNTYGLMSDGLFDILGTKGENLIIAGQFCSFAGASFIISKRWVGISS